VQRLAYIGFADFLVVSKVQLMPSLNCCSSDLCTMGWWQAVIAWDGWCHVVDLVVVIASAVVLSIGSNGQVFATSAIRSALISHMRSCCSHVMNNFNLNVSCCTCISVTVCLSNWFRIQWIIAACPLPSLAIAWHWNVLFVNIPSPRVCLLFDLGFEWWL